MLRELIDLLIVNNWDMDRRARARAHPLGQRVKYSPEELLGEQEFILGRCAVAAPARRETVVLPVLLVVVR